MLDTFFAVCLGFIIMVRYAIYLDDLCVTVSKNL
jgi:SNF family Na+-dependent transporter